MLLFLSQIVRLRSARLVVDTALMTVVFACWFVLVLGSCCLLLLLLVWLLWLLYAHVAQLLLLLYLFLLAVILSSCCVRTCWTQWPRHCRPNLYVGTGAFPGNGNRQGERGIKRCILAVQRVRLAGQHTQRKVTLCRYHPLDCDVAP